MKKEEIFGITHKSYNEHGCPHCGAKGHTAPSYGPNYSGASRHTCRSCNKYVIILYNCDHSRAFTMYIDDERIVPWLKKHPKEK